MKKAAAQKAKSIEETLWVSVNKDKFELHLRNLLNQQLGVGFVSNKVDVLFHDCPDGEVCQVNIKPANEPLVIRTKDKNGKPLEKFYVRSGNSSPELPMSEMSAYIKERFV
jgi:hypothetical protein